LGIKRGVGIDKKVNPDVKSVRVIDETQGVEGSAHLERASVREDLSVEKMVGQISEHDGQIARWVYRLVTGTALSLLFEVLPSRVGSQTNF
jgi:hypothetical protein